MIRVLLVDDHASFRQPLAFMLQREADITVVGQARSIAEALQPLPGVDVGVFDLDLPDGNGADLIDPFCTRYPDAEVLILTASAGRRDFARAVEAGAAAVLHKSAALEEIIGTIRRLAAGEYLLSPRDIAELKAIAREQRAGDERQRALSDLL